MIKHSQIRSALRTHLLAIGGIPSAIAWEGRRFDPTPGTAWLRERYAPAGSPIVAIGSTAIIEETILYMIDVFAPPTGKLMTAEDYADRIIAGFRPGLTAMVTASSAVTFRRAERSALVPDPEWLHIPVTIRGWLHRQNLAY